MLKKVLAVLFVIHSFGIHTSLSAQSLYYNNPGYQQPQPGELLREGIGKLLAFVEGGGHRHEAKIQSFVQREIVPYFDFGYMTQWVAGPRYNTMNNEQRRQMELELKALFFSAMLRQLATYEPTRIQYLRPRGNPRSGEITLGIQSYPERGYPMRLSFRMYLSNDGWKVYDVSSNGQSALMYFRNYFMQKFHEQQRKERIQNRYQRPPPAYYR